MFDESKEEAKGADNFFFSPFLFPVAAFFVLSIGQMVVPPQWPPLWAGQ